MSEQSPSAELPSHSCDLTDTRPIYGTIFSLSLFLFSLSLFLLFFNILSETLGLLVNTQLTRLQADDAARLAIDITLYTLRF